jgi:pimeloyl-ACP methyl ester carboxylesterase
VLLIHGGHDPSVKPAESERLRGMPADARLRVAPGRGHFPNREYPGLVAELIEEFMWRVYDRA